MRSVAIIAIVVLLGVVACTKPSTEETTSAPTRLQKVHGAVKGIWAKRPWAKKAAPKTTEESHFGFHLRPFHRRNSTHHNRTHHNKTHCNHTHHNRTHHNKTHRHHNRTHHNKTHCNHTHHNRTHHNRTHHNKSHCNHTHHNRTNHSNHSWNNKGYRFEETAPAQTKFQKLHGAVKGLWAKRPWAKKAAAKTTEESGWNSKGFLFPVHNRTNKTNNSRVNHTRNTWNNKGHRFEETAPAQTRLQKLHGAVKGIWAKRPWAKKAAAKTTEESNWGWNSQGVHYPTYNNTWNTTNHTNNWNSQGYRFEETETTSTFQKVKNAAKGVWAKRPWKKAD